MTQEEKAKAYDEALEKAKELKNHIEGIDLMSKIFPELRESEDEKMKKEIIAVLKGEISYTSKEDAQKYITWLEKQGKESITIDANPVASYNNVMISDKIEPKFHKGDCVVNRNGGLWEIKEVLKNTYDLESLYGSSLQPIKTVEQNFHLWTIQDAKDGDVLVHNNCTFIFIGIKDGIVQALEENLLDGTNPVPFGEPDKDNDYHPATKEQCDLLFQKMHEAGYEWDADKKELKLLITNGGDFESENCEQKPTWSEEDEEVFNQTLKIACAYGTTKMIDWLKSLKGRVQSKQEWSEEDESLRLRTIGALETCKIGSPTKCVDEQINWLKSLKERYTWKPTDEQMKVLDEVLNFAANHESPYWNDYIFGTLNNLIRQLKN